MYFKKEMLKTIKSEYFRNSFDSEFPEVKNILVNLETNLNAAQKLKEVLSRSGLAILVDDYEKSYHQKESTIKFKSKLAQELQFNLIGVQKNILSEINKVKLTDKITQEVIDILISETEDAVLVGGAVRDAALKNTIKDYDFATSTPINQLEEHFLKRGFKVQQEGLEFLVLIVSKDGKQYEIANFRSDIYEEDSNGRHPTNVRVGTPEEDAFRRDFTINALFWDLKKEVVLDYTGEGVKDLLTRTLRFVGNAEERIREDYIRAFRFMRFVKRGYIADAKSSRTIKSMYKEIHEKSNPQRVLTEFMKMEVL